MRAKKNLVCFFVSFCIFMLALFNLSLFAMSVFVMLLNLFAALFNFFVVLWRNTEEAIG